MELSCHIGGAIRVGRDDSYFLGPKMRSCSESFPNAPKSQGGFFDFDISWTAMTRSGRQNATAESGGLREAVV